MKEADIVFGQPYAVETENGQVQRCIVRSKVPVQPGMSRSRTYNMEVDSTWRRTFTIDASKILMPWATYERTPDYARANYTVMREQLREAVVKEFESWYGLLADFLVQISNGASTSPRQSTIPPHPPAIAMDAMDVDRFVETTLRAHQISVPLDAFIKLADLPLPPLDSARSAVEQYHEIDAHLCSQMIPLLETELRDAMAEMPDGDVGELRVIAARYATALSTADIPGPHPLLIEFAKLFPGTASTWLDNPQFGYLALYIPGT